MFGILAIGVTGQFAFRYLVDIQMDAEGSSSVICGYGGRPLKALPWAAAPGSRR